MLFKPRRQEAQVARLRSIEPGTQVVRVHPTEVDCFYQTLTDQSGQTYLHLSTFGSDERQSTPKSSQSLQLDETAARQLLQILRETFHL
ncbi:hypothetical protein [Kribbella sp. NPDC006257]|uniref:hypothetical protein n=1 Tax=Kribbella sp. NPDC006257 TaxID=3156738 RepID=UPI00339ED99E